MLGHVWTGVRKKFHYAISILVCAKKIPLTIVFQINEKAKQSSSLATTVCLFRKVSPCLFNCAVGSEFCPITSLENLDVNVRLYSTVFYS